MSAERSVERKQGADERTRLKPGTIQEIVATGRVQAYLQPVVCLTTAEVIGYEALARGPKGHPLHSAPELFAAAEREDLRYELEVLCRQRALEAKSRLLRQDQKIFVNIDPQVANCQQERDCPLCDWVEPLGIDPAQVVLEVTERISVGRDTELLHVLEECRHRGCQIALDDLGSGFASLESVLAVKPHFIKLDGLLSHGIDGDGYRSVLVHGLVRYCKKMGIGLVAERVDSAAKLEALIRLGVEYGQGFYLAPPAERPAEVLPEAQEVIRRYRGEHSKKEG